MEIFELITMILFVGVFVASYLIFKPYSRFVEEKYGYDAGGWSIVLSGVLLVVLLIAIGMEDRGTLLIYLVIAGFVGLFVYRCFMIGPLHAIGLTTCQLLSAILLGIIRLCKFAASAMSGMALGHSASDRDTNVSHERHETRVSKINKKYDDARADMPAGDEWDELGADIEIQAQRSAALENEQKRCEKAGY